MCDNLDPWKRPSTSGIVAGPRPTYHLGAHTLRYPEEGPWLSRCRRRHASGDSVEGNAEVEKHVPWSACSRVYSLEAQAYQPCVRPHPNYEVEYMNPRNFQHFLTPGTIEVPRRIPWSCDKGRSLDALAFHPSE